MTRLQRPGLRLYFEDHPAQEGGGPRLFDAALLVHGWACASSDWAPLIDRLTPYGRVVTADLRGCGRSGTSDDGYLLADLAGDMAALLDHLGIERALLIGHSAGTEVAATLAARRPDRVTGLVCVDPSYGVGEDGRARIEDVARQLAGPGANDVIADYFARLDDAPGTSPELAAAHRESALHARPDVACAMYRRIAFGPGSFHFRPATDRFLAGLTCPVLAFYRNDERAVAGRAFMTRPDDGLHVYAGAGHWLHQEQPDRFTDDLTAWLTRTAGPHTTTGGPARPRRANGEAGTESP
ncbi:alpha/beta fold hydrolase [Streptantibioticus silvisoli]|uniref:Alpha/beta hydrolase n=1 Tax=Streptantibioticus silvisoli TaxID=2705255 RepID=A0ABT6W6S2_9ACTN|nr:alpha/beta hydrolase [Streptantibioticus silvisoli]MDI5966442.1 alpha/beta hydrolase [Streptantibioticus silvisoli]